MALSIQQCLQENPMSSKQLQDKTGLSQTVVARQIRELGNRIIKISNGRPPIYALTKNAFGADDNLLLCIVDAYGHTTAIANLRPLAHGGFFVQERVGLPSLLLGEAGNGVYEGLPYFIDDLRPQGFLGRQIASELSKQSDDFPPSPERWNAQHIGRYLISNGDDLPGNLKFGQQAYNRVRRKLVAVTSDNYPELAESVIAGDVPGSSAGGEQPKFTAYSSEQSAHVIVKFSPKGNDPVARRWKDILITEYHAAQILLEVDFAAAETRLIEKDGRLFLESHRFDRSGQYGRMSMLSLQNIDAEFTGLGEAWVPVVLALHKKGLVSAQHVSEVTFLWLFGRFINNSDMHLGNLSFGIDGDVFRLLPTYDMCCMGFAPKAGEVPPFQFSLPNLEKLNFNESSLSRSKELAGIFWKKVSSDTRISSEFKVFLKGSELLTEQD